MAQRPSTVNARTVLGIASLVPAAYAVVLAVALAGTGGDLPGWFWIPHLAVMALGVALIVYCLRDIWRRNDLTQSDRSRWALLVVLLGFVTMPVYLFSMRRPSQAKDRAM
jgi:peptidoglycan/LPS O-acetylase OafA/YrhL